MINISDINASEIMIGAIAGVFVAEIWNFIKRKYAETRPIKKLKKIKLIKTLGFILTYILPVGTIVWMIADSKTEPTFKNIGLFIIICVTLIYNLLMSHIINLYKINRKLAKINSEKLTMIDSYAGRVNSAINELQNK